LAIVAAETRFLWSHAGVPAFQQDWVWPASQREISAWLDEVAHGWFWNVLGVRHVYPFAANFLFFQAISASVFGPRSALIVLLSLCVLIASSGAGRLAWISGVRSPFALGIALAAYSASPVLYNKVVAGHTFYWIGYALLPWVVIAIRYAGVSRLTAFLGLVLCLTVSWSQAQFLAFDCLAILATIAFSLDRRTALVGFGAIATALVVHSYSIVEMLRPTPSTSLRFQHATRAGVATESVKFSDVLAQTGYPPGYFETLTQATWGLHSVPLVWSILGALGAAGLVVALASPRFDRPVVRAVALVGLIGAVLVRGVLPPFGGIVAASFEHLSFMSLLKELYHCMVLVSLAVSLGLATLADAAAPALLEAAAHKRIRFIGIAPAVFTLALCASVVYATLPMLGAYAASQIDFRTAPTYDSALAEGESRLHEPARVLLQPTISPLREAPGRKIGGGVDSAALQPWRMSPLFAIAPEAPVASLYSGLLYDNRRSDIVAELNNLGVAYIVARKHIMSSLPEQAKLPRRLATDFSSGVFLRKIAALGFDVTLDDDEATVYRNPTYPGLVAIGEAPILTAERSRSRAGLTVPYVFPSDVRSGRIGTANLSTDLPAANAVELASAFVPASAEIPLDSFVNEFDATRGWTLFKDSYYWNDWLAGAPFGSIFTLGRYPLHVGDWVAPDGSPGVFYIQAAANRLPLTSVSLTTRGVRRRLSLRTIGRPAAGFSWYESSPTIERLQDAYLTFDRVDGGVAISHVLLLTERALSEAVRRAASIPRHSVAGQASRGQVESAEPTRLAYTYERSAEVCTLMFRADYDPRWSASVDGVPAANHFPVNGWMNGWSIPCGRHRVVLAFDDRFYRLTLLMGRVILAATVILLIARLAFARRRRG
jgi:hypothetical protein